MTRRRKRQLKWSALGIALALAIAVAIWVSTAQAQVASRLNLRDRGAQSMVYMVTGDKALSLAKIDVDLTGGGDSAAIIAAASIPVIVSAQRGV